MPKLVAHLKKLDMDVALIAFEWFACLLALTLPENVSNLSLIRLKLIYLRTDRVKGLGLLLR